LTRELPLGQPFVPRWGLFVLLGGVFVLKLVVLLQLKDHPLTSPAAGLDTTAYADLARRVAAGDLGLGPGLYYVSPLYIYVAAAVLAIFHSFTALRVLQIALGTASVALIFFTTRAWFGERAAWIAAILAAFTGLFTFYEVLILQSAIDAFLTSAALYALTRGLTSVAQGFSPALLLAGLVWGIQTLNRPNVLIAALGVALVMLIVTRRPRLAALLVAGVVLGMAPVAIRNIVVSHEWSLVSSHGGLNFYIGNSDRATGFYQNVPGITPTIVGQEQDTRRVAAHALGHPVTDAEASSYFFRLGRTWIEEHPGAALVLFARKFAYAFHAAHVPLPHSYPFYAYDARTALRFYPIGPWLLTPLGLVGLIFAAPSHRRAAYIVWSSFVPAYAAAVALFFVAERYRLPLLVPLCAGAGAAIDRAIPAIADRRPGHLLVPGSALLVLLVLANWRLGLDDGRWAEGLRMAQRLVVLERYEDADSWASRLRRGEPHPGAADYGTGAQLLVANQPDRALVHFRAAHDADPADPTVEYALGQALLKTGRADEAVAHLRRGFEAGIEIPGGGYDLAVALQSTGDLTGAALVIRRINPAEKDDVEVWLRLGRLAMGVKAPDVAEPFFRHATEMRPDLARARQQYGLNLLVAGRFDEALRELSEAVRLDPRDPDSLSHLAYVEAKLGRRAEARAHAEAALAIDPNDQLARQLAAALR
jgi:tetratricopeptide (TPR) repeat protein